MNDSAIRIENLGKLYRIGSAKEKNQTFREALTGMVTAPWRALRQKSPDRSSASKDEYPDYLWALKGVSCEIKRGEVVGIIGRNGAGKSTLLKILSRITDPTEGRVIMKGRVGSLLEVGTGFHSELTGEENIYLSGTILGLSSREISLKFDSIVDFSEISQFIKTPVKHYSSGMYMRLAFAVAAHLEPDILLIDEVLAVGDAAFQKKCLGKMSDIAGLGRTVLFVSHNMGAVARICERAIHLDHGTVVSDGVCQDVVNRYQSELLSKQAEWKRSEPENILGGFSFLSMSIQDHDGHRRSVFNANEPITVGMTYKIHHELSGCQIGVRIYNSEGIVVCTTSDTDTTGFSAVPQKAGTYDASFTIPEPFLYPGTYSLRFIAHLPYRVTYEYHENALVFEVTPSGSYMSIDGRIGIVSPLFHWKAQTIHA